MATEYELSRHLAACEALVVGASAGATRVLLELLPDEPVNFSRPCIDVLFESAADVFGSKLCALVLTGPAKTDQVVRVELYRH